MFILPLCGGLIGRAMEPVSLRLKEIVQRRFPHKTVLYVGMDGGVIMQNNAVIVTGLVLMPVSIAIAFVLPGNRVPPPQLAPLYTSLSAKVGAVTAAGYAGDITAFTDGGNPVRWWFLQVFQGSWYALAGVPVVLALCGYTYRRYRKEREQ